MRLLLLSRSNNGRLRRTRWAGLSLRVGLLVDFAFQGRLHDDLINFSLVTTPRTGLVPADGLLRAIENEPDRSLASWIGAGPSVREALAEQWIRENVLWRKPRRLQLHPRYGFTLDGGWSQVRVDSELARLGELVDGSAEATTADACLTALAVLAGLIKDELRPKPELIRRCGEAAWLVEATDALIENSEMRSSYGGGPLAAP